MTTQTNHKHLVYGPIQPEKIAESISKHNQKHDLGAHDIFLGQVRADEIDNRTVTAIDYSAYESMADQEITRIREEILQSYDIRCMHVYHALGRIEVGELSLFVFASSAHRQPAMDAVRNCVERIKAEVPIFGKEVFEDGAYVWKENR